jgi:hypothetical protein
MTECTQSRASTKRTAVLSPRNSAKGRAGGPHPSSTLPLRPSQTEPGQPAAHSPDFLSAKMETLKTENKILRGKLSEVRARSRQLLEVNKELKNRFSGTGGKARGKSAGPTPAKLSGTVHRFLVQMREILDSMQRMKFPFQVVSEEEPAESERSPAGEAGLDDPVLQRLEELRMRYHLPMPVIEKVQTELLSARAQRTQAMELVREMHKLLTALGEERVKLAERVSHTSEMLNKILEGAGA